MAYVVTEACIKCKYMDCVEVCPPFDHAELSSLAACTLVWAYLSGQARRLQTAA